MSDGLVLYAQLSETGNARLLEARPTYVAGVQWPFCGALRRSPAAQACGRLAALPGRRWPHWRVIAPGVADTGVAS